MKQVEGGNTDEPEWFADCVRDLNAAIDKIATNHFGKSGKEIFWRVFRPGLRAEISRWKKSPSVGSTEKIIALFEGRGSGVGIEDQVEWSGVDDEGRKRLSLRTRFQDPAFSDLLGRLRSLKIHCAGADDARASAEVDETWDARAAPRRTAREDRATSLARELLDLLPTFLGQLEAALGQGGNLGLAKDLTALLHQQPDRLSRALKLGRCDDAIIQLQALYYSAFEEQAGNPIGERLRLGSAAPIVGAVEELLRQGGARSDENQADQGNQIAGLLVDLRDAIDAVGAGQALADDVRFNLDLLRDFAVVSSTRPALTGRQKIDIALLDHRAWPVRQLYLGALKRIEDIASEIVGLRLDWAPQSAIFRDALALDYIPPDVLDRLQRLPSSIEWRLGPEMVKIQPGEFMMGACQNDDAAQQDEFPRHQVKIGEPFALSRFLITNSDYLIFAFSEGIENYDKMRSDPSIPRSGIPFDTAQAYADWLSKFSQKTYRLPSEAEWEFACRAGTDTLFWWGNEPDPTKANYGGRHGRPTRLGEYPPNPWRLSDISGNLSEWCADHYIGDYSEHRSQVPVRPPRIVEHVRLGEAADLHLEEIESYVHVSRGGAYGGHWLTIRTSNRFRQGTSRNRSANIGLRIARTL
jgi:formylglycine-generating enzyme required for sulfatase activity